MKRQIKESRDEREYFLVSFEYRCFLESADPLIQIKVCKYYFLRAHV